MLKVVSGKFKNRIIPTSNSVKFKPSTTRTREAIFSIINSWDFGPELEGASILDVFCGSGSLGIEALSRGAGYACFVDENLEQINLLKTFIAKIEQQQNAGFIHASAQNLPYSKKQYEIVLMDPPYFSQLASDALKSLKKGGWLADGAVIILEVAAKEDVALPNGYEEIQRRVYGNNKLLFIEYNQGKCSQPPQPSAPLRQEQGHQ